MTVEIACLFHLKSHGFGSLVVDSDFAVFPGCCQERAIAVEVDRGQRVVVDGWDLMQTFARSSMPMLKSTISLRSNQNIHSLQLIRHRPPSQRTNGHIILQISLQTPRQLPRLHVIDAGHAVGHTRGQVLIIHVKFSAENFARGLAECHFVCYFARLVFGHSDFLPSSTHVFLLITIHSFCFIE